MAALRILALGLGSVAGGAALTALVIWFFQIPMADAEMLAHFPTDWTVFDVLTNGFAVMAFVGATRAIYVTVGRYMSGKGDPPPYQ